LAEYDKIARYYDAIFAGIFPYDREVQALHRLFRQHGDEPVRHLLDASCGTGSHLLRLAHLGYGCSGSDISPGMLTVARQKARQQGLQVNWFEQDIKHLCLERTFDAVISLYGLPLMLVAEDAEPAALQQGLTVALKGIQRHLNDGGIFVFNIINAESPLPYPGFGPWSAANLQAMDKDGLNIVLMNKIRRSHDLMFFKDIYLVQEKGALNMEILAYTIWLPGLDQLQAILEKSGFEVLAVYSQLSALTAYNPQSLDVTIVSKKGK
jgi:ubiquinone/menaquinone biosynthesis C-methylase UbiE